MALIEGLFYFLAGVYPLLSMRRFLMVTGPKGDLWLVKTVGILIEVIGVVLFCSGFSGDVSLTILLLAACSSACLTAVGINCVSNEVISKVYLLDVAAELLLIAG
jgi:hypothetical protein